jgi:hypothetical protein
VNSISELLKSDDPLSREAIEFLLGYREEDTLIDYKETFRYEQEKEWRGITKDVMAFANTHGGYLVFGVRDVSFEVVGLDPLVTTTLANTNQVLQKINCFIEPEITGLRAKIAELGGKQVVVFFVPPSVRCTHVFSKDGKFRYPGGDEQVAFRKGTLYVRRSAGNHLADSRDLDELFNRRLDYFRESLLEKITKVVDAPQESNILIVSQDGSTESGKKIVFSDSPDAILVQGLSFSTAPKTDEEAIAGWIAMFSANSNEIPSFSTLWKWYENRKNLNLSESYRIGIAKFCLLMGVPVFYWIQGVKADDIKQMILDVASLRPQITHIGYIVNVCCFLGKSFHRLLMSRLKEYQNRLDRKVKTYPKAGSRPLISPILVDSQRRFFNGTEEEFRVHLEAELDRVVSDILHSEDDLPDVMEQVKAQAYDCYLYAQDDRYIKSNLEVTDTLLDGAIAT